MDNNNRDERPRRKRTPEEIARRRAMAERKRQKEKQKKRIRILSLVVLLLIIVVVIVAVVSCTGKKKKVAPKTPETESTMELTTQEEKHVVELVSVGDVLMHTPLLNYARNDDGSYDFNSIFDVMREDISRADLAICNQETPIDETIEADGGIYYIFNTPGAIGDAEINAGFDVALQASNHSYDEGADGILHTVEFWQARAGQITMVGMNNSQEMRDTITVVEKNGIKIALLNYTYGLNGFELPYDMQYLVTLLYEENKDIIASDIQRASEMADFVIVFPHWGTEDLVGDVLDSQTAWAQFFTENGADLIIGTHPHVCEKIEWITSENQNKSLCYYSVGNYASNQQETPEVLGGMAKVTIVKENGVTYIDESTTGVVPIVTHNIPWGGFTNKVVCYKLQDYTEDLVNEHDIVVNGRDYFTLDRLHELATEIFGDWIINY